MTTRQVEVGHYSPEGYDELPRWISYWYQINAVLRTGARSVLEIGSGSGVFARYLQENLGIAVTTFDFEPDLGPDVVGDVREVAGHFGPDAFDCVCAFQVLEHIPFEDVGATLEQMATVARANVLISLPYWGYFAQMRLRFWKRDWTIGLARKIVRPYTWKFNGQHYWEIGTKQFPLRRVRATIEQHLQIDREYFCPDNAYHYFFECSVRPGGDTPGDG